MGLSGAQGNAFARNRIGGNPRAGVILSNTEDLPSLDNRFEDDVFEDNGVDVANTSAARTPASGNCAQEGLTTAPAELAPQLVTGCGNDTAQPATTSIAGPEAPAGVSFLRVSPPRDQPNLAPRSSYPPLPAAIEMPDLAAFTVPDASFLSERSGTR